MKVAVIPTLNEERNIGWVLDRTVKTVDRVVIVDGLSSDNTTGIARKFEKTDIVFEKSPGKGNALIKGFQSAFKYKPRYIVMLDGDAEKDPNDIPRMVEKLEKGNADIIVGFRGQKRSFERLFFNHFASWWIRLATGYRVRDCLSGFNVIRAESLKKMDLKSKNFEIETELMLEARRNGLRVLEFPVSFPKISPSKLKRRHMKEINNFFDTWTLDWIKSGECDLPLRKKILLSLFCRLGLVLFA